MKRSKETELPRPIPVDILRANYTKLDYYLMRYPLKEESNHKEKQEDKDS